VNSGIVYQAGKLSKALDRSINNPLEIIWASHITRHEVAAPGPCELSSAASLSPFEASRSQITTEAPAATKTFAQPDPIPLLPPVIMAVLSNL